MICSQLSGKHFCDCINWKGVCIYQEYHDNKDKVNEDRKEFTCKILNKKYLETNVISLTILVSHKLAQNLYAAGSYVFMRNPEAISYYDTPISIMDVNLEENTIKVIIEIKGIKTKSIEKLSEDEKIVIRGPYWNGVFGLKNVAKTTEGHSLVVCSGIGMAPMIPVIKKLYSNGNKVTVILDKAGYKNVFIEEELKKYDVELIECDLLVSGEFTKEAKDIIEEFIENKSINLIHCSGANILIFKLIELNHKRIKLSCCNNAKLCCGEGVCGSCTERYEGHKKKRLCKVQAEPNSIFEGRRLI
ncbi:sulfide/dihydroorotate dehydrogenase-like FAD/NAD-binding protein [Clostridium algidicarnis]|nr:sulfide/dihydroorotate dehydrogenase-like FAD/NAD-binding protein [Clostridium algidicarnis]MBU3208394.1 sulfide/dihydroorotate dehydrogenase-like FAD/NAD-binding protein [Clostridium algidicarnis]MBU3227010.1 sulfide/dihydroorotate dehydrogenase-like FAD/NAD-binding protein [Clostridium algidicarnis]MBU3250079.1 sulfide/dihydroorotate dehydrogenase-like FAD/NAD-binding protein [Clostridium algidicarnis]